MKRTVWRSLTQLFVCAACCVLCGEAATAQPIKIGFLLKTMQEERYVTDQAIFLARAEALGAEVMFESSGNDELSQVQQFEKMLEEGCQVIVLQPVNTETAGGLVEKAHAKGIKVVGYDSMLQNGQLDVMVMQDSWAVGKLQGAEMVKWFQAAKGKVEGNVVLIMGQPGDANAAAMSEGVLQTIHDNPGLKLVDQREHIGWSPDLARKTTENLLVQYQNKIDAFVCNNSGLASGVVAALDIEKLADSAKVFVAGSDADLRNVQYIAQGKQTVEIFKKIKPLAYKAAEIAVAIVKDPAAQPAQLAQGLADQEARFAMINNGATNVPTLITPVVLVTKDTIDQTVIVEVGERLFTREQVYGK